MTRISSVLILSSFTISDTPSCVFPFIYHGKSYYSCTKVDSQNHPWCATTANYDKSPQWKYLPPPCVFPFIYRGKSYNSCTEDASENRPWCATIANYDQYKTWKYCATKEYGGNSDGKQCAFPFTYKNQTYYTCTNEDAEIGRFWCATTGSYDKEEQWSYCADTSKITVGPCVFPFIYKGQSFSACTKAGSSDGKLWCSLSSNYDREPKWTYCTPSGTEKLR
uniref:Uncharacterized protein n=1 Tax=Naja naja TaxID=35670 RepID=A0A8C6Y9B6_NAJNA